MLPELKSKKLVNPDTVVSQYFKPNSHFDKEIRSQILDKLKDHRQSAISVEPN